MSDAIARAIARQRAGERKNERAVLAECQRLVDAGQAEWLGVQRRSELPSWTPVLVPMDSPVDSTAQLSLDGLGDVARTRGSRRGGQRRLSQWSQP